MRAVLRCDATSGGGVGHLGRVLAVAEAATEAGWDLVLCGEFSAPVARRMLEASGLDLLTVPAPGPEEDLAALAHELGADVLHADHYGLGPQLREGLAERSIRLCSIEDDAFGRRPADVAIEPTPAAFATPRPDDGTFRVFGGADWVPLRRDILDAIARPAEQTGLVVVMIGGTDPFGLTPWCLDVLAAAGHRGPTRVVTGDPIVARKARDAGAEPVSPSPRVVRELPTANFVVAAAGTSLWEIVAMDVPCATVAVTENQDTNYDYAVGSGAATGLGRRHRGLDREAAADALREAIADPVRPSTRLRIDGQGSRRIVDAWGIAAGQRTGVQARGAVGGDVSLVYDWRNAPEVRGVSRTGAEIPWEHHRRWFDGVLADPRRELVIVELDGAPAAVVRFDFEPDMEEAEVSVVVGPRFRGRGLAATLLSSAIGLVRGERDRPRLVAEIRRGNEASRSLFSRVGFVLDERPASTEGFERWVAG